VILFSLSRRILILHTKSRPLTPSSKFPFRLGHLPSHSLQLKSVAKQLNQSKLPKGALFLYTGSRNSQFFPIISSISKEWEGFNVPEWFFTTVVLANSALVHWVLLMHTAWRWEDDVLMIIILFLMACDDALAGLLNATVSDPYAPLHQVSRPSCFEFLQKQTRLYLAGPPFRV
jgi:hypothetical protein